MANNPYERGGMDKDVEAYNARNERAFRRIMSNNAQHDQCQETIQLLREETERLALDCQQLASRNRHLESELDAKQTELHQKELTNSRLNEVAKRYREMIFAEAGKQNTRDYEAIEAFVHVRQGVLSLAKSRAISVDQAPVLEHDTPQHVRNFYMSEAWKSWKRKDRDLHVREKIFEILYHFVLDTASFGIRGSQAAPPEMLGLIAQGLSEFEATAKRKDVSTSVISNWRAATFECVEALDVHERRTEQLVQQLWCFIDPILDKKFPEQVEVLQSRALEVCKSALDLTIMMRKSESEYRCEAIPPMVQSDRVALETWADAHAVDGGRDSEAGENVAYVLFGALTKMPTSDGRSEIVLVKAEVVMEKKTLW